MGHTPASLLSYLFFALYSGIISSSTGSLDVIYVEEKNRLGLMQGKKLTPCTTLMKNNNFYVKNYIIVNLVD